MGSSSKSNVNARCSSALSTDSRGAVSLKVLPTDGHKVRPSKTSKWRAGVLIAVHLLVLLHVAHWLVNGRTISPVEPSEAMYTLNKGHVNAGFLFFLGAIAATLLMGRFFCGWGCHFVAYQDLCAWMLKKAGIKPKPFRARLLIFGPLALAIYMFVWPSVYRYFAGQPFPEPANHLLKTNFWETFPGPVIAIATFLIAGMAIVYFLGAKGFCTYACPYGGFFGLADQVAPGRILVTDACEHCGHCTAVCTSNVRVHEEVALYGMVVDPGCMKCMDCVSVCPNNALHFGFAKPPIGAKPSAPRKPVHWDFSLSEELVMVALGVGALLAYRGLYDQIPLLLAMGLAAMFTFLSMKTFRLVHDANVRLQNLTLKRGGRLTRGGFVLGISMATVFLLTAHSAAVQFQLWRGKSLMAAHRAATPADDPGGANVKRAISKLEWVNRWSLLPTYSAVETLIWAYLDESRISEAEATVAKLAGHYPNEAGVDRARASVLVAQGKRNEAIDEYRRAVARDPSFSNARSELSELLIAAGRADEVAGVLNESLASPEPDVRGAMTIIDRLIRAGKTDVARGALERLIARAPDTARAHHVLGTLYYAFPDRRGDALAHLRRAVELDPKLVVAQYDLGLALLYNRDISPAIRHLTEAARLQPDLAVAHYNLGVALFMAGRLDEAIRSAKEALRLQPNDADARDLIDELHKQLGSSSSPRLPNGS